MTAATPFPEPSRIIREPECRRLTGLSRTQRWRLIQAGKFPIPVPLGPRARGWVAAEVSAWIEGRVADREAA